MDGKKARMIGAGAAICILFAWAAQALATTNGEQRFYFFGKAGDVIWIGEDIGGEYQCSILHQIIVAQDEVAHGMANWKRYGKWAELIKLMRLLESEDVVVFEQQADGSLGSEALGWTVSAPAADPNLAAAFSRHVEEGGSEARSWRQAQPDRAMQMPIFKEAGATHAYSYGRGLYVNYGLQAAYLLPKSRLLVLLTEQPQRAVGLDTMDGFMILRVREGTTDGG